MNVLLSITMPFGGYKNKVLVADLSKMPEAIEASDPRGRIRLKEDSSENSRAVRRIASIMSGEVKPCRSFMAGNNYFGRVRFEYERPDLNDEGCKTFFLSVQVFSALGGTLEEHDERYKRNKDLILGAAMRENG